MPTETLFGSGLLEYKYSNIYTHFTGIADWAVGLNCSWFQKEASIFPFFFLYMYMILIAPNWHMRLIFS